MKKAILTITVLLASIMSQAQQSRITPLQQQQAMIELDVASSQINQVLNLLPRSVRYTVGAGLVDAQNRISRAQNILGQATTTSSDSLYFCTITSSFNGDFSGKGQTMLEAKNEAMRICTAKSGWAPYCQKNTFQCEKAQ